MSVRCYLVDQTFCCFSFYMLNLWLIRWYIFHSTSPDSHNLPYMNSSIKSESKPAISYHNSFILFPPQHQEEARIVLKQARTAVSSLTSCSFMFQNFSTCSSFDYNPWLDKCMNPLCPSCLLWDNCSTHFAYVCIANIALLNTKRLYTEERDKLGVEYGGSFFLRNICIYLSKYNALHPRRP